MIDYDRAVELACDAQRKAQQAMDMEMFVKGTIDEISLLFGTPEELEGFVKWAVAGDKLEHFNSVPHDQMDRLDVTDRHEFFHVRFEFLRLPDVDWRIEAMCVLAGLAPLHSQRLAEDREAAVMHASWKCADTDAYRLVKQELGEAFGTMVPAVQFNAEYQNSYGIFSYWGDRGPYFKPRVNLRD